MDTELKQKVEALESKIDKIYQSVEKTRKYFLWTLITTLAFFILPLIGLLFAIPKFLGVYSDIGSMGL